MNDLSFEETVDRFCQGIVIGIPDAAYGRGNLRLSQSFSGMRCLKPTFLSST